MRLMYLIFALILAMLGMLIWLMLLPEPAMSTGSPHPDIAQMNVGGEGLARLGDTVGIAFWLQATAQCVMILLIALGVSESRRTALFWSVIGAILLLSLGVWSTLYLSYLGYLDTGETAYLLGFPTATTVMLFGIWGTGATLCLLYVAGFRRFIFSEEDEAAYEELLAASLTPEIPEGDSPGTTERQ